MSRILLLSALTLRKIQSPLSGSRRGSIVMSSHHLRIRIARSGMALFLLLCANAIKCGKEVPQDVNARPSQPALEAKRGAPAEEKKKIEKATGPYFAGRYSAVKQPEYERSDLKHKQEIIDKLNAIGYLQGSVEASSLKGTTVHDSRKAYEGFNFFVSGHAPEATLMDMDGNVLHRWHRDYKDTYPNAKPLINTRFWRRAHLFRNGDILAIHDGLAILKLDKASKLIWARSNGAHHDLDVAPNGDIYLLTRKAHMVPRVNKKEPVLEDFITVLSSDGRDKKRVSVLEIFENSSEEHSWIRASRVFWKNDERRKLAYPKNDLFHTNSIEVLHAEVDTYCPPFCRGDVLLSMCHLDMIAVVNLEKKRVLWSQTGPFAMQHDPSIVTGGRLMLFNNQMIPGRRSSAMIIEPASGKTEWQYSGTERSSLYSSTCGTTSRLPNGNILITETDNGRSLEITRDKRTVWEFYNPNRAGKDDEYIASLFEMVRLPQDFPVDWADK